MMRVIHTVADVATEAALSARRILSTVLVALLGATASLLTAVPARATAGDGWYTIMNISSGLFLAPRNDTVGVAVWQTYPSWGTDPYQQPHPSLDWLMGNNGSYTTFRNAYNGGWPALTINSNATTTAKPAIVWNYSSSNTDQQWTMVPTGTTYVYMLKNRKSGKCLAIGNASTEPGVQAIEWTCESGHAEQQWWIRDNR